MIAAMRLLWCLVFLSLGACSSSSSTPSPRPDARVSDAGVVADAGPSIICGTAVCTSAQYCRVDPTATCAPQDGGVCAAPADEACEHDMLQGCTRPQARACHDLPTACAANPSCACLVASAVCPGAVNLDCKKPAGQGLLVECPFN